LRVGRRCLVLLRSSKKRRKRSKPSKSSRTAFRRRGLPPRSTFERRRYCMQRRAATTGHNEQVQQRRAWRRMGEAEGGLVLAVVRFSPSSASRRPLSRTVVISGETSVGTSRCRGRGGFEARRPRSRTSTVRFRRFSLFSNPFSPLLTPPSPLCARCDAQAVTKSSCSRQRKALP
jgi:hypothetical protein